jgi:hypothetical protein
MSLYNFFSLLKTETSLNILGLKHNRGENNSKYLIYVLTFLGIIPQLEKDIREGLKGIVYEI